MLWTASPLGHCASCHKGMAPHSKIPVVAAGASISRTRTNMNIYIELKLVLVLVPVLIAKKTGAMRILSAAPLRAARMPRPLRRLRGTAAPSILSMVSTISCGLELELRWGWSWTRIRQQTLGHARVFENHPAPASRIRFSTWDSTSLPLKELLELDPAS